MAKADAVLDEHIAEPASVTPMGSGELDDGPDSARPPFDCVGLPAEFETSSADVGKLHARVNYSELEFSIRRTELPAGFKFRKGDVLHLSERAGSPWFKVNRVDETDPQRSILTLTETGRS